MTGPEHYRRAEALLRGDFNDSGLTTGALVAMAQAHATLALAAATAADQATTYDGDEHATRSRGWAGVA
jgi:hypothetical protein